MMTPELLQWSGDSVVLFSKAEETNFEFKEPEPVVIKVPEVQIVYVDKEVEVIKEVPVEKIVYVDREVEVIKEVPVEKIVYVDREVIVELPVEVIKEVPFEVIKEIPVEVEVIKEVIVEKECPKLEQIEDVIEDGIDWIPEDILDVSLDVFTDLEPVYASYSYYYYSPSTY